MKYVQLIKPLKIKYKQPIKLYDVTFNGETMEVIIHLQIPAIVKRLKQQKKAAYEKNDSNNL